jgi:hypothetical protein
VVLLNPKNAKQKVAFGKVSGQWGLEKFHGAIVLEFLFKVDVATMHMLEIPLMHPHEANDQVAMGDVVGTCTLWNWKYVKIAS